ncbi:LOW QUALITY PROTEIN: uncharacterized protein LOC124700670 [Lolium rigidum]|uniref:LOW QUALITY PROTEIN: uncharacterized protein LOC124700670 n=1 Tax=Lolium rigidum TaxID=89674 RepID=UPI001F5CE7F2|nr:LOW QUALITY PROTEIN: uncharacterized protein LOC124700670 [Lolium rigidum]
MAPRATPMLLLPLLLALLLLPAPTRAASLSLLTTTSTSNATLHASTFPDREPIPTPDPTFLQDLIDTLTTKYNWDPDAEVRVWPLDADAALVGAVQRYEFRARAGSGSVGAARVSDETVAWSRPRDGQPAVEEVSGPDGIDVVPGPGALGFGDGVRDLDLVGPFDVAVADAGLAELRLPSLNATYTGLKRVLVGAGIALKITGAQKVYFTHTHSIGLLANGSLLATNKDLSRILPHSHPTCAPLLHVSVVGSVIMIARETDVSGGQMKYLLSSDDTVELLSDKPEVNMSDRLISACVFCSISPRLPRLENQLKTWFSQRNEFNRSMNFIEAKVTSLTLVKFRLELERDITEEDDLWDDVPEWKTLPMVQRVSLDVIARVQEEGRLKSMQVKKVRSSFQIVDASSWSSLTSNVSFTDFMSFVLPPDPLSLDVKW